MDEKTYKLIIAICNKQLHKSFHDRHLEDCIQECVMLHLEGRHNIKWNVIEYCRRNGIGNRGKQGAKALEHSLSVDAPSPSEDSSLSEYLLDRESISRSNIIERELHESDNQMGALEEFLSPLNLDGEVMKWATKSFKVKMN